MDKSPSHTPLDQSNTPEKRVRYTVRLATAPQKADAAAAEQAMREDPSIQVISATDGMLLVETTEERANHWAEKHSGLWTWAPETKARIPDARPKLRPK